MLDKLCYHGDDTHCEGGPEGTYYFTEEGEHLGEVDAFYFVL